MISTAQSCNPRPADLGSREQFNAAGVVVSAYKYHSLLLHLLFPVPSSRYPPISSILMRVVFISCTSLTRSIYEFVEMLVLVLEPEVRACSVVSSRSSSLFCTMTSVYFCFSLSYVRVLFYPPPRTHSSSFSSFSCLPSCCRARHIGRCRMAPHRSLAKLNHFHREYIRHVQNLPDDRERSYVISAHQHIIAYLFFTLTYIALQEYSYSITPIFFPSTTSIPTTVLIIRPSYHPRIETAM